MGILDKLGNYISEGESYDDIYEDDIVYYVGDDDSLGINADDELRVIKIMDGPDNTMMYKVRAIDKPEIKDYIVLSQDDVVLA